VDDLGEAAPPRPHAATRQSLWSFRGVIKEKVTCIVHALPELARPAKEASRNMPGRKFTACPEQAVDASSRQRRSKSGRHMPRHGWTELLGNASFARV
jgi:hypothetical protein